MLLETIIHPILSAFNNNEGLDVNNPLVGSEPNTTFLSSLSVLASHSRGLTENQCAMTIKSTEKKVVEVLITTCVALENIFAEKPLAKEALSPDTLKMLLDLI